MVRLDFDSRSGSPLRTSFNAHLGRLFGRLSTGRSDFEIEMKKASLAAFDLRGDPSLDRAELRFFLPPRVLEKLTPVIL